MDALTTAALRRLDQVATAIETAVVAGAEYYANGNGAQEPGVYRHFTAGNQGRYGWAALSPKYAEEKARGIIAVAGGHLYARQDAHKAVGTIKRMRDAEIKQYRKKMMADGVVPRASHIKQIRASWQGKLDEYVAKETKGRAGAKLDTQQSVITMADRRKFKADRHTGAGKIRGIPSTPMLVRTGLLRDAVCRVKHRVERRGDMALIYFAGLPDYAQYLQQGTSKMPKRSPVDPNEQDAANVRGAMQRHIDAQLGTGKSQLPVSSSTIPGTARTAV